MNSEPRMDLLEAIGELRQRYPDWRLGQLIANLATAAGCQRADDVLQESVGAISPGPQNRIGRID